MQPPHDQDMPRHHVAGSFTRRRFLHAAAGAAALPLLGPRTLAVGGQTPANERINLGFIGTGKRTFGMFNNFLREEDARVVAVCDVDQTRREHARQIVNDHYGDDSACEAYNDYRDLLARDDIDAVVIVTPDHWHAIQIIDAAKAGKDIYCEKPLTLTIHEARLCIEAVRKHDVIFQTGSQRRSADHFRLACEYVRNGRLGEIRQVQVAVGGPSWWCDLPAEPVESGLDWDRWLGPAPWRPYHSQLSPRGVEYPWPWRDYREYSGGNFADIGAHEFDIVQWALGMDESGPVRIVPPDDPDARRGVTFQYENGVEVVHHDASRSIRFFGSEGEMLLTRNEITADPGDILEEPIGDDEIHLHRSPGHVRDWLDGIRERRQPVCDIEVGARSATVCHLGNLAYWYRTELEWNPQSWSFENPAYNNLLDRTRRDPYQLPEV